MYLIFKSACFFDLCHSAIIFSFYTDFLILGMPIFIDLVYFQYIFINYISLLYNNLYNLSAYIKYVFQFRDAEAGNLHCTRGRSEGTDLCLLRLRLSRPPQGKMNHGN